MYLGEDGEEFADESVLYDALKKYCEYMPVEIYFDTVDDEDEETDESTAKTVACRRAQGSS